MKCHLLPVIEQDIMSRHLVQPGNRDLEVGIWKPAPLGPLGKTP